LKLLLTTALSRNLFLLRREQVVGSLRRKQEYYYIQGLNKNSGIYTVYIFIFDTRFRFDYHGCDRAKGRTKENRYTKAVGSTPEAAN
jgi:hypothetical protein